MAARLSNRQLWTAKLSGSLQGQAKGYKLGLCLSKKRIQPKTSPSESYQKLNHKEETLCRPFKGCILGVDPSLRRTGIAIIDYHNNDKIVLLHRQALDLKHTLPFSNCLGAIAKAITELLEQYPISHIALEQTIFVQNHNTAQILGAVRGAIIATGALKGLPIFEYPPLRIKQALTGFGRASKEQLAKTVAHILKIPFNFSLDEGDAAAAALCHAFTQKL